MELLGGLELLELLEILHLLGALAAVEQGAIAGDQQPWHAVLEPVLPLRDHQVLVLRIGRDDEWLGDLARNLVALFLGDLRAFREHDLLVKFVDVHDWL